MIFRLFFSIILSLATTFCSLLVVHQKTINTHVTTCITCGTEQKTSGKGYPYTIESNTSTQDLSTKQLTQQTMINKKNFGMDWTIWFGVLAVFFVIPKIFNRAKPDFQIPGSYRI